MKKILLRKIPSLVLLVFPLIYLHFSKEILLKLLTVSILGVAIFEAVRFLNVSFRERAKKKFAFMGISDEENRLTQATFLLLGVFVVVNYFEREIAIISLAIALTYNFLLFFALTLGRIKIRERSLEGIVLALIGTFMVAHYAGSLLGLNKIILFSAFCAPLVADLFLNWPDENFTIPFLTALLAQFVKNSF